MQTMRRALSLNKRAFSTFENYDMASKVYDTTRKAVGMDKIQIALRSMYEAEYQPIDTEAAGLCCIQQVHSLI